jgi:hypothetical protein
MITDGRLAAVAGADALVERVAAAGRAGVDLIQIREPAADDRLLAAVVRDCVAAVRGTPARVIVNDRLDVALAGGAHGLHLKSASYAAARVRPIVPDGFLLGRSVHSVDEAILILVLQVLGHVSQVARALLQGPNRVQERVFDALVYSGEQALDGVRVTRMAAETRPPLFEQL